MEGLNVKNLSRMLNGDESSDEETFINNYQKGSVLNPSDINGGKKGDEVAKPFQKVEVKNNTRGQVVEEKKEKVTNKDNQIWNEDEVKDIPYLKKDQRQMPKFDCNLKQNVGTEDIFLGLNGSNPTSTCCQEVSLKIYLPDTKYSEIQLDVNDWVVSIQTPKYYLYHNLPRRVNEKAGNAKWVSEKCCLELILPIVKDKDMEMF